MRSVKLAAICLFLLGAATQAWADDKEGLKGTWRQETEGLGVSYWELTPKGEHTYDAQEYGLASVKGTARLKDGHLIITIEGSKDYYKWHLKGTAGKGELIREGQAPAKSEVRFIGK